MTGTQLQLPAVVQGAVDPAAGRAAKTAGMARAQAATAPSWAAACQAAIAVMAKRGVPFQAADLLKEGLLDEPEHPNQWGPQFGAAARRGVIRPAGYVQSKRATVKASACRQWIGAGTAQGGEAA
ncbi:hypothetical protein FH609_004265 [Streptomyces sp. 3MP-14]|uniref:Uncharacterized protein n=1 Tax=Streptomyces mimosae TaxID=2586635 RepID=A0A5N6A2E5_9ACTN|nr:MULTISPECIES: hypothetical protein [Streptomyces]KAB8162947.1 hypothetical protein FH607_020125 [Streptomyces mimosae]KAB8179161.1 hypothetical protein FH609_004265 [Streptomyces sp. 3MP-14]